MGREWKPGDVALAKWRNYVGVPALFVAARQRWIDVDGVEFDGDENDLTLRPLVVIDPENREDVERLSEAIRDAEKDCGQDFWEYDQMVLQDALRDFADPKPPKPEEPTGLGAVVEDASGTTWVRAGLTIRERDDWRAVNSERVGWWSKYADIAAVRVLSEGVKP